MPPQLHVLTGQWQGTNRLWLDPAQTANESAATAVFQLVAQEKFATLHYTWADSDQPQSGVLLFGQHEQQVSAAWVDSWHMQDNMMQLTGISQPDGTMMVKGSYAAPPGPDWSWQITLQPLPNDQFKLLMHNITPDGDQMLAVEALFARTE
jgi:hypothetical protein